MHPVLGTPPGKMKINDLMLKQGFLRVCKKYTVRYFVKKNLK